MEPRQPGAETHLLELVHGARREPVTARLLSRVRLALEHDHVVSRARQPIRGRGSGRTSTDDEYVGERRHLTGLPSLSSGGAWPSVIATSSGSGATPLRTSRS